jgi:hypothetical protein
MGKKVADQDKTIAELRSANVEQDKQIASLKAGKADQDAKNVAPGAPAGAGGR